MTKLTILRTYFYEFSGTDMHLDHLTISFFTVMLSSALLCFLVSEITRNYSQVDKLWSLMPLVYSLLALSANPSPRVFIMCFLVAIWGFRLSFNFYRKGGYNIIPWKGEEDYRWKIMQQHPMLKGRIRFGLFNLFFISFYQHFLIMLFSTPLLMAAKYSDYSLVLTDILAASLMMLFIVLESVADNQQFRFQKQKRQMESSLGQLAGSIKNGFISDGLWSFVRHPNFVSEQAIWICFYFFGVAASGKWINWTLSGPFLLVLLFIGSTQLTESISSKKYPGYAAYKRDVPKFFPRLLGSKKR
jgi:steroid 5-alpha reductase family enzyme